MGHSFHSYVSHNHRVGTPPLTNVLTHRLLGMICLYNSLCSQYSKSSSLKFQSQYIHIYTYIIIPIYIYNYIIHTYIICTYRMYKMSLLWSWKLSRWLFPRFTVLQCSSGWPKWRWIFQGTSWLLLGCGSVAVGRLRGLLVICPDISKTIQGGGPPSHKLVYKPQ